MICFENQLTGFCLIGAFTQKVLSSRLHNSFFLFLGNKICVSYKTTLYARNNVFFQLLYTTQWTHLSRFPIVSTSNFTRNVRRDFIDFEGRIHVETMTSIRRGNFDVDSTFKIDEISMSSLRGFFYIISTSNKRNCLVRCSNSIIS